MKTNSISKFVNSLSEFLMNAMANKYEDAKQYAYRYNNMKVYMDPTKEPEPHFYVSLGISEACFGINDGRKLNGSLGNEDGYVSRWAGRSNINNELRIYWKMVKDAVAAENEEDSTKKMKAMLNLQRLANADEKLDVDMTGTGIDKLKREKKRKSRFTGFKKDQKKQSSDEQDT